VGVLDLLAGQDGDGRGRVGNVLLVLGGRVDHLLLEELEFPVEIVEGIAFLGRRRKSRQGNPQEA